MNSKIAKPLKTSKMQTKATSPPQPTTHLQLTHPPLPATKHQLPAQKTTQLPKTPKILNKTQKSLIKANIPL